MTTSTRAGKARHSHSAHGFSTLELCIAMAIFTILGGALVSSLGYVVKSHYSLANYTMMDSQLRRALELVGRDIKQFSPADASYPLRFSITDAGTFCETQSFSCCIPSSADSATMVPVVYTYSRAAGTFSRTVNGVRSVLVSNVNSFSITGSSKTDSSGNFTTYSGIDSLNTNLASVKQLQLSLTATGQSAVTHVTGTNSQQVTTAQYSIRRKG